MGTGALPTLKEIQAAADRIRGVASRTPLVESPALSKRFGLEVYLKLECFQPIRVFKIRGAYNKISQLSSNKIVAASSGNHGLAVSYSSHRLGKNCTIVIPETAVRKKRTRLLNMEPRLSGLESITRRERRKLSRFRMLLVPNLFILLTIRM